MFDQHLKKQICMYVYRVSPNDVHVLGWEVENIVRTYNYIGKYGWKTVGVSVRQLKFVTCAFLISDTDSV